MVSIRMRRTLCGVLFDKVTALSVESMQKISSGKLVSMISSDLFALERQLTFSTMILVQPFANLFTFLLIGFNFGWWSSLIVLGCFLVAYAIQNLAGFISKRLKAKESKVTDQRIKLVSDIVVGARTIKCYGWENHFLEKIEKVRNSQKSTLFKFLLVGSLGVTLYQVSSILSIFLILI